MGNRNGTEIILHISKGVEQGDTLAMIAYRIGILPVIKNLKRSVPDVPQPWYADDAILDIFAIFETYFYLHTLQGPGRGYHSEPTKSVLIVRLENIEAGKVSGARHGFRVCTGARYIGGYIGDDESKCNWLIERTLMWERNINTISETLMDIHTAIVTGH